MRYLELVGTPPPESPQFFRLIAHSPHVTEARLMEWNPATEGALTALYAIDGDAEEFKEELGDSSVIVESQITRIEDGRFYVLIVGRPSEFPLFQRMLEAITQMGLILITPVVYRDGRVYVRIVGTADVLQSMVDAVPAEFEVDINEIGMFPDETTVPTSVLSERQRATIEAALELGYYESPRNATHADIAEQLGCAPNTVTEHLQKAESKLFQGAIRVHGG